MRPCQRSRLPLTAALQVVTDDSNDEQHLQRRLTDYATVFAPLDGWLSRFVKLKRPLDGSRFIGDVLRSCHDVADSILRAKAAAAAARSAAEAAQQAQGAAAKARGYADKAQESALRAAQELLNAKKAEIQAQALLTDPKKAAKGGDSGATEVLKAQAAAKCAEQLALCTNAAQQAKNYAGRAGEHAASAAAAVERAKLSLGDATESVQAEVRQALRRKCR